MIDYRERRLKFWCQKVLPLVYDESLSYYELLCKIMKHLSEAETDVSALEQWLEELDAAAVKKVYSEYPLKAVKEGNTVKLELRSHRMVTSVAPAEGSPITVDSSGTVHTGPLDENDPSSPTGTTSIINNAILDIENATTTNKGAMSAEDKQKVDRLYNTFVSAGENIVVSSTTSANGDTTYNVGVDPNFKVNVQNDYLVGDWEWNACLDGHVECGTWNTNIGTGAVVLQSCNFSASIDTTQLKVRQALKGVVIPNLVNSQYNDAQHPCIGVAYGADQNYPFARVNAANPVVDGETYFATTNSIDVKLQLNGVGVGNRRFTVYLGSQSVGSGQTYSNQYLTSEDRYYPSYGNAYIPAKYSFTTDANGFASFTIPAGLTAKAITTSSTAPVATCVRQLYIVAEGVPEELYGNVRIDSSAISVKANLLEQ